MKDGRRGFLLGTLGVVIFAMTLPMTRLAVGDAADPQLPPAFVTAGRAALAGLLSLVYLWAVRAHVPERRHWPALALSALGTVLGGVVRVSQVQLLQPFLALLFAVPVLGETLQPATVAFSLAVIAVVFVGRRMPVQRTV